MLTFTRPPSRLRAFNSVFKVGWVDFVNFSNAMHLQVFCSYPRYKIEIFFWSVTFSSKKKDLCRPLSRAGDGEIEVLCDWAR